MQFELWADLILKIDHPDGVYQLIFCSKWEGNEGNKNF